MARPQLEIANLIQSIKSKKKNGCIGESVGTCFLF